MITDREMLDAVTGSAHRKLAGPRTYLVRLEIAVLPPGEDQGISIIADALAWDYRGYVVSTDPAAGDRDTIVWEAECTDVETRALCVVRGWAD